MQKAILSFLAFLMTLSSAAARLRTTDTDPDDGVNTVEIAIAYLALGGVYAAFLTQPRGG